MQEVKTAKTIQKHIDVGKWKIRVDSTYDAVDVRLKGMRNRHIQLIRLDADDFRARFSRDPDGKAKEDWALRGTPMYWHFEAQTVQLWPAPAHQWDVEIDLRPKQYSGC